jgi:hypothetical protein
MDLSQLKVGMKVVFKDVNSNIFSPLDYNSLESNAPLLSGKEGIVVINRDPEKYPGKYLGICFKQSVNAGHTLDGLVPHGHGQWINPEDLYTPEMFSEHKLDLKEWLDQRSAIQELLKAYL